MRRARLNAGLSQTALADATNTTYQQIQKYERGVSRMPVARLFAFCSAMGQDPVTAIRSILQDVEGQSPDIQMAATVPNRKRLELHKLLAGIEDEELCEIATLYLRSIRKILGKD